jgi:lipopolysaccharide assembly protein B
MDSLIRLLKQYLPARFAGRRYLLDQYHFDLTSFDGDISQWLSTFPISRDNIEIYLALAELFRRRGEFDKAVSVHEAILSANVSGYSRSELELEVAQDYYAAGVLSHAEEVLFSALGSAEDEQASKAFRLWLAILESEQEWYRAVELVEQYGQPGSGGLRLANLYCEYIEQSRREKRATVLLKELKKARRLRVSSRAELLAAELLTEENRINEAIQVYRELLIRDAKRVDRVLPLLERLSVANSSIPEFKRFLRYLHQIHPSVRIFERLVALSLTDSKDLPADLLAKLEDYVRTGDSYFLTELWLKRFSKVDLAEVDVLIPTLKQSSLQYSDEYVCTECGFYSEKNVWQCPQCLSWETLYSRYELKIDRELKKVS